MNSFCAICTVLRVNFKLTSVGINLGVKWRRSVFCIPVFWRILQGLMYQDHIVRLIFWMFSLHCNCLWKLRFAAILFSNISSLNTLTASAFHLQHWLSQIFWGLETMDTISIDQTYQVAQASATSKLELTWCAVLSMNFTGNSRNNLNIVIIM